MLGYVLHNFFINRFYKRYKTKNGKVKIRNPGIVFTLALPVYFYAELNNKTNAVQTSAKETAVIEVKYTEGTEFLTPA